MSALAGTVVVAGVGRPPAANPCAAKNPCGAKPAAAVKDPVGEATFKQYKEWKKVNAAPVPSATHGNRYVFTYLSKTAEPAGVTGRFPFPKGAVLAKESFEGQDGKPKPRGPVANPATVMSARGKTPRIEAPPARHATCTRAVARGYRPARPLLLPGQLTRGDEVYEDVPLLLV